MRNTAPKRILVIVRGHIGDLVGAVPALRDLRRGYPEARITALVNDYVRGILDGCPYVDEVIYGFTYARRGRGRRFAQRTTLALRVAGRFDTIVGLRHSPKIVPVLGILSGARTRVGYDQPGILGKLLTHNLGPEPPRTSNRLLNLQPVAALGVDVDHAYPRLDWYPPVVREQTSALLAAHGLRDDARFAVFQVSCDWGCNEWRSDKWAALADYLVENHGLKIVITGTDASFERAKCDEIKRLMHRPEHLVSLHGQTSLPQLFEVVARSALVVATDSALTQVALAQRTPSVILFGVEHMEYNGPLPHESGDLMEPVQHWGGPDTAPPPNPHCRFGESSCHTRRCCENSSLRQTSVDEVMQRVDKLLAGSVARAPASCLAGR